MFCLVFDASLIVCHRDFYKRSSKVELGPSELWLEMVTANQKKSSSVFGLFSQKGNCLFRAVADQVYGDAELCDKVREQTINHEAAQRNVFEQFVVDESFDDHLRRMRQNGQLGDHTEIQAMAEVYCRPVEVYSVDSSEVNVFQCGADKVTLLFGKLVLY